MGIARVVTNYEGLFSALVNNLNIVKDLDVGHLWMWSEELGRHIRIKEIGDVIRGAIYNDVPNLKPSILSELGPIVPVIAPVQKITSGLSPTLISFKNGVYDVATGELSPHTKTIYPNQIPHDYPDLGVEVANEVFKEEFRFINELFGSWASDINNSVDEQIITEILEVIGYCMTWGTKAEKAVFLVGNAKNGKSVFTNLLTYLLGPHNASAEGLGQITENIFASANLYGMLANINSDISVGVIKDPAVFKKLVSGDRISSQFKSKDAFVHTPYSKLVFCTNKIPYVLDGADSDAIDRRLKLIHFRNKFSKGPGFADIEKYLYHEKTIAALIWLAVDALRGFIGRGYIFTESVSARKLYEDYLYENDQVFEYLSNITVTDKSETLALFNDYMLWCSSLHYKPVLKTSFVKKVVKYYRRKNIVVSILKVNPKGGKIGYDIFRFHIPHETER